LYQFTNYEFPIPNPPRVALLALDWLLGTGKWLFVNGRSAGGGAA
jgi:hypothetical protein